MNVDPTPDAEHVRRYSEAVRKAREEGTDAFQMWFETARDARHALVMGAWDWTIHILTPTVCAYMADPEDKVALEIGCGGGRILNTACEYFKEVIGIDIHDDMDAVADFLRQQGRHNFRLMRGTGRTIDLDDESIDFVYSFIVFQHLPSIGAFESYLRETYRCLKAGGLAQLFFGRFTRLGRLEQLRCIRQGYQELGDRSVNITSLLVSLGKARRMAQSMGFTVLETGTSYRGVPNAYPHSVGGQSYITLLKPS